MAYFKQSGIKTRYLDADGAQRELVESGSDDEAAGRAGGRRARGGNKPDAAAIDADMDDDESEDDEDFEDDGSGDSDDEEGEEEQEEDMSMVDEDVDKDELKALAKNAKTEGKRRKKWCNLSFSLSWINYLDKFQN